MKTWRLGIMAMLILLSGCAASRLSDAERLVRNERYDEAVKAYLKEIEPQIINGKAVVYYDRDVITGLGEVYWFMNKYETALKILQRVATKDPFFGKAQYLMGLCQEAKSEDRKAVEIYSRYIKIPASDPYRYVMAGRLDWLTRKLITREVQNVLSQEQTIADTPVSENSVAVLYFMSQSEDPQWAPLQKGLAEMLTTDLAQATELQVVERLRLNYLMEEMRLGVADMLDESTQARYGQLLGAKTLIKGAYMVLPDMKMTLDAGIFESNAAVFPKPSNYEGTLAKLFQMEKQLVLEIFDYFGIQISLEVRERLLQTPTDNMQAFLHYCLGLDALDRMDHKSAQRSFQKAIQIDPAFQMARDRLVPPRVWEITHNRNLVRMQHDVAQFVHSLPRGGPERLLKPEEGLITAWARLQRMGVYQGAGFLPGNETREGFSEADTKGARVLPELIGLPPDPIRQQQ